MKLTIEVDVPDSCGMLRVFFFAHDPRMGRNNGATAYQDFDLEGRPLDPKRRRGGFH